MTYIISHHRFHEHPSFFQAQGELARLRQAHPERDFQIYKVRRVPAAKTKNEAPRDE